MVPRAGAELPADRAAAERQGPGVASRPAVALGWREFVGDSGESISLEHFGASAPYEILYEQFGITPERVVAAAHSSLSKVGATHGSTTGN